MNQAEKDIILKKAQKWFIDSVAENHIKNTIKLKDASKFGINPFLAVYLSNFLTGKAKPEGIAKALVYPRALGTSITTFLVPIYRNLLMRCFHPLEAQLPELTSNSSTR